MGRGCQGEIGGVCHVLWQALQLCACCQTACRSRARGAMAPSWASPASKLAPTLFQCLCSWLASARTRGGIWGLTWLTHVWRGSYNNQGARQQQSSEGQRNNGRVVQVWRGGGSDVRPWMYSHDVVLRESTRGLEMSPNCDPSQK